MYTNLELPVTKVADETATVESSADAAFYNPRGLTARITPNRWADISIDIFTADGLPTDGRSFAHSTDPVVVSEISKELIENYNRMLDFDGESLSVVPPGTYNPHGAIVKVQGSVHVKAVIEIFHADGRKAYVTDYTHSYDPKVIAEMTRELVEKYSRAMDFGPSRIQAIPAGTYNPRGVTVWVEAGAHAGVRLTILEDGNETSFSQYTHSYDRSVIEAKTTELVEEYNQLKEIESN